MKAVCGCQVKINLLSSLRTTGRGTVPAKMSTGEPAPRSGPCGMAVVEIAIHSHPITLHGHDGCSHSWVPQNEQWSRGKLVYKASTALEGFVGSSALLVETVIPVTKKNPLVFHWVSTCDICMKR